jgi:hypothetical protein
MRAISEAISYIIRNIFFSELSKKISKIIKNVFLVVKFKYKVVFLVDGNGNFFLKLQMGTLMMCIKMYYEMNFTSNINYPISFDFCMVGLRYDK